MSVYKNLRQNIVYIINNVINNIKNRIVKLKKNLSVLIIIFKLCYNQIRLNINIL